MLSATRRGGRSPTAAQDEHGTIERKCGPAFADAVDVGGVADNFVVNDNSSVDRPGPGSVGLEAIAERGGEDLVRHCDVQAIEVAISQFCEGLPYSFSIDLARLVGAVDASRGEGRGEDRR